MKYITSIICCLAFAIAGWHLAISDSNKSLNYNSTISAANLPTTGPGMLPLDPKWDLSDRDKNKPDTVYLPSDTVYAEMPDIVINLARKNKPTYARATRKRSGNNTPAITPDTLVKNQVGVVREEQTTDTIGPPKESIILIVDGEEVYKR